MPDWKRCEDEMPDPFSPVIIYGEVCGIKSVSMGYFDAVDDNDYPIWFDVHAETGITVTHWLPLPAPPEEEK